MADSPALPTPAWATLTLEDDGVLDLELTGTGSGNRLGPAFWAEAGGVFAALDRHPAVRVILLRGSGKRFSTGMDLTSMAGVISPTMAEGTSARARTDLRDYVIGMQQATLGVAVCRKPVIAAIHGHCIGGAVDLVCAADVRLATRDTVFSVRETRLAMVADMGTLFWLPRIVGPGQARELTYTGEDFDGERALQAGLVTRVHDGLDALLADARAVCRRIAANPPLVVQGTKQVMMEPLERDLRAHLAAVATWNAAYVASADLQEAITAFFEKRAPAFQGD